MPPRKRSRQAEPSAKPDVAVGFFRAPALERTARAERREHLREEAFKRQREKGGAAADEKKRSRKGPIAAMLSKAPVPIPESLELVKEKLRKDQAELEVQILALVAERPNKEGLNLAELDFSILDMIWQWKLLNNCVKNLDVRTGMLYEHQQIVSDIVIANGMVSWYRPINLEAQAWLSKGGQGKALLTKGKSSCFDCIVGLIPLDVRLSKLMKDPATYDKHSIAYYQSNMDFVIRLYDAEKVSDANIEATYRDSTLLSKIKIARTAVATLETKNNQKVEFKDLVQYRSYVEMANELPKQVAIHHAIKLPDGKEYKVYYMVNSTIHEQDKAIRGEQRPDVVFGEDAQPVFVIEKDGQYFAYNTNTHAFDKSYVVVSNLAVVPLLIMAYQQFELDEEKVVRHKTPRIVTADYDEGASVALRIQPFMQKTELATDSFSLLSITRPQSSVAALQTAVDKYTHETLCRHEVYRNAAARDIATYGTMGRATETQRAILAHLRDATGWTINHGPEANSPAPQKFEPEETYPCFYPDGRVEMLTGNEETVCAFVNEQRAKGFPLAVNPRWDWEMDAEGRFSVPRFKDRFDWEPVDHFLKESQIKADAIDRKYQERGGDFYEKFLTFDINELRERVQKEDEFSEIDQDRILMISHNLAKEIVDILLQMEEVKVQPVLVYPELIESYKYRVLSKEDRDLYQHRITNLIGMLHSEHDRVEIAAHDSIVGVIDFYGKIEIAIGGLEKTTPEYRARHKHDEGIKKKLEEKRQKKLQELFEQLQTKNTKFEQINIKAKDLFALLESKIAALATIFLLQPLPVSVVGVRV